MKSTPSKTVLSVAQEIAFAKALASNEKGLRDRALKKLKRWLSSKSSRGEEFSEEGFMRIWKGLFYCVWMSDKPLVQEDVVEAISQLMHCFKNFNDCLAFIRCFFLSMSHAWFGLDSHRMDKYLMLVRRFLRQVLESVYRLDWEKAQVELLSETLSVSFSLSPLGLILHITDVYMEELAKVGRGELKPETTTELIKPFVSLMVKSGDTRLQKQITNCIFFYLLRQSEEGIKHNLKFQAWKELGFPGGNINVMEEVELNSDEEMEQDMEESNVTALDARAGYVDVELPPIAFDAKAIAEYLNSWKQDIEATTKARKQINHIVKKFTAYTSGIYPLGTHKYEVPKKENREEVLEEATLRLLEFEKESIDTKKPKIKNKKKHKKSSTWEVSFIETNDDAVISPSAQGSWEVTDVSSNNLAPENLQSNSNSKVCEKQNLTERLSGYNNTSGNNLNTSTEKTNKKKRKQKHQNKPVKEKKLVEESNDWGDSSWDFTTENDLETEIVVQPKRRKVSKMKTPKNLNGMKKVVTTNVAPSLNGTPGSTKKVEFVLNKNTSQGEKEYKLTLKNRPSIPFDAEKKPLQGVLKTTPINSPINPFYNNLSNTC